MALRSWLSWLSSGRRQVTSPLSKDSHLGESGLFKPVNFQAIAKIAQGILASQDSNLLLSKYQELASCVF